MRRFVVVTLVAMALLVPMVCQGQTSEMGRWTRMPLSDLTSSVQNICSIAVESSGTAWALARAGLYFWDGTQWKIPSGDQLRSIYPSDCLIGGTDRPVYAVQRGQKDKQGRIYRLSDGAVTLVTDFYLEDTEQQRSAVFAARSGMLVNWGGRYIAAYVGNEWKRQECSVNVASASAFESAGNVYITSGTKLYRVDGQGAITQVSLELPEEITLDQGKLRFVPWGIDNLLAYSIDGSRLYACSLATGKLVASTGSGFMPLNGQMSNAFPGAKGAVWAIVYDNNSSDGYCISRIDPDGAVTRVCRNVEYQPENLYSRLKKGVATDDGLWLCLRGGLGRTAGETVRRYDWRDGVNTGEIVSLIGGPDGKVFAASNTSVYAFDPSQPPAEAAAAKLWREYGLSSNCIMQDSSGCIWAILDDHRDEISRWDGKEWIHVKMPSGNAGVVGMIADDKKHIIIAVSSSGSDRHYVDVCSDGAREYGTLGDVLTLAMERGATRFTTDHRMPGCILLSNKNVIAAQPSDRGLLYWDGEQITPMNGVSISHSAIAVFQSSKYGALIATDTNISSSTLRKFCYYDKGQLVNIEYPLSCGTRWLAGPRGTQPFDEKLLVDNPGQYVVLERVPGEYASTPQYRVVYDRGDGKGTTDYVLGDIYNQYNMFATPSPSGGFWLTSYVPTRLIGGKIISFDPRDTPLEGKYSWNNQPAFEDPQHGVWYPLNNGRVMVKNVADFKLKLSSTPAKVKRSLLITAEPDLPGLGAAKMHLFWRLNGGAWQGSGKPGGTETIFFPATGKYKVEVMGLDDVGAASQITEFSVEAEVTMPETKLITGYVIKELNWIPPVEIVPSQQGDPVLIAYRFDGGTWQTSENGMIKVGALAPGAHSVEIAAAEPDGRRDATPLKLDVVFKPDYDLIIENRMDAFRGYSYQSNLMLEELKSLGAPIVEAAKRKLAKLEEAKDKTTAISNLRSFIMSMEAKPAPGPGPAPA